MNMMGFVVSCWFVLSFFFVGTATSNEDGVVEYGTDVSYPMHHRNVTTNYPWLAHNLDPSVPTPTGFKNVPLQPLGNRQTFYDDNIQGCIDYYGTAVGGRCISNERGRIHMSLRQPQSMVNYTQIGFTKIRAPDDVMTLLQEFWQANKEYATIEKWKPGNTYTNHWKSPTKIVNVENKTMVGGGLLLKQKVWDAARSTIEAWTGQRLAECSLYGIRRYETGAILATHVDRLPLVSSAIINVDQDVDEPWPLEVIGHDGKAYNVTMVPGDLVLYESHSVLHGRPFPLKGRFMANIFVHFEPVGPMSDPDGTVFTGDRPPYLLRGSQEEANWLRQNPNGWRATRGSKFASGATEAHLSANKGDVRSLNRVLDANQELVHARDENGWTPLHEAIRASCFECVVNLLERGADANALTNDGRSPLHHAKKYHKQMNHNNRLSHFLERFGAREIGPEL